MKTKVLFILLVWGTAFLFPSFNFAQNVPIPTEIKIRMHQETQHDNYLPNAFNGTKTSPSHSYLGSGIFTKQVNVNSGGQNILGDAANEPSIAVDPTNPDHIVIGWRQFDNISSNFRQAGWGYTSDAGQTWTFPGVIEPGIFRSDPVLDYDAAGNFYYNSLTNNSGIYSCMVYKSTNGGAVWDAGAEAKGGDKQWMTIDRTAGVGSNNIYSYWNAYYSSCSPGNFTRSSNGGSSFEDCVIVTGDPYWGTMSVGNDGEMFVSGSAYYDGIKVSMSSTAQTPGSTITWDFSSYADMDGYITSNSQVNPAGILGQAYVDVDRSNGPGRGNVYVLASVVRLSNGDPADVMFAKSTDGGLTWDFPVRVNDDPGSYNYQWFGTMSVAPNGRIDVVWLDTREDYFNSDISALYYSYSTDQGNTWSLNEKMSETFDPHVGYPQQDKMGDYFHMVSDNTGAHLAWANTLNGEEDVYYSFITPGTTGIEDGGKKAVCSVSCYPNPVRSQAQIRYQVAEESPLKIMICDIYGKEITTLVNQKQSPGIYTVTFSAENLPAGYYLCRLTTGTNSVTTPLVIVK